MTATSSAGRVRLKSVALPNEHGGWGFLFEPIVLGLILAPDWAGLLIGLSATCIFLARHPLKTAITDRRRSRRYARTAAAERFVLVYAGLAAVCLIGAVALTGPQILVPALVGVPFALVMIAFDVQGKSRQWLPELAGPIALSTSAAMIAVAGGWSLVAAIGLIPLLATRTIPTILYVRTRLRFAKEKPAKRWPVIVMHIASIGISGAIVLVTSAWPSLLLLALGILLVRAVHGLQPSQKSVPAKTIGFQELGYGFMLVILTAAGYIFGI